MSTPEEHFAGNQVGLDTCARVLSALRSTHPDVTVRVSVSQVALRRRRGFAYLWAPGRYLHHAAAPVVLSIASASRIPSDRFREVVHPGPWMHHLEVTDADQVDDEVLGWLRAAADAAG
ncbi:DUF5655 domain-containing protein [Ornithinimicrobium pekingense]|uniref:DUF5655 domain-containing protein n=1 Tax=Ornithinimicrobium pekingense TaxID=384677 RepID=A0ABQ2F6R8_9MICO|nr:DUF5655 domain-containing protein [Ornithinimicrobium pekingense]GGK58642.1 hypothetical protein GCM10011509_03780 [Ornithinimicrobium pekingense]